MSRPAMMELASYAHGERLFVDPLAVVACWTHNGQTFVQVTGDDEDALVVADAIGPLVCALDAARSQT